MVGLRPPQRGGVVVGETWFRVDLVVVVQAGLGLV